MDVAKNVSERTSARNSMSETVGARLAESHMSCASWRRCELHDHYVLWTGDGPRSLFSFATAKRIMRECLMYPSGMNSAAAKKKRS